MVNIADAVGIKATSIDNRIDSKQELLEGLLLRMADLFSKGIEAISKNTP